MEYVGLFSAIKSGKAYVVEVDNLAPDDGIMTFHIDSGASVSLVGLNSFYNPDDKIRYEKFKIALESEIFTGRYDAYRKSGSTVTEEEIDMYPCKCSNVSISGSKPVTLYFHIYLGNIGMPLLGFDYIDDTSYHHTIGGDMIFGAVADNPGERFYTDKVIDIRKILSQIP